MADSFPTALQRTSDERWVALEVVAHAGPRAVARVREAPEQTAVIRSDADEGYDAHLRRLLASPPPDAGRQVHLAWPVDLLHDLDGRIIGYTALRPRTRTSAALADVVDPARRAEVAPQTTRRHLLRIARHTATATAALHHAGHGRIRGEMFRVDDRAGVIVVRVDQLVSDASAAVRRDDEVRLGHLMVRLLSGHPWPVDGPLAELLAQAGAPGRDPVAAPAWFHVLREAERTLPRTPAATRPAVLPAAHTAAPPPDRAASASTPSTSTPATPQTGEPAAPTDLAAALRRVRAAAPPGARTAGPTAPEPPAPGAPRAITRPGQTTARATAAGPAAGPPGPAIAPAAVADGATAAPALHTSPQARPSPGRARVTVEELPPTGPARAAFAVAAGLTVGAVASVAPFAAFVAVTAAMVLSSAVGVGRRRSTRGPQQLVAITVSRLLPFATGGVALGAFILLDLLLLLGLCMAIAARLFDYGPGFTLTWVLQLPEVPGLVRAFSFAVGAAGGLSVGAQGYDRLRASAGTRRAVVAPALALAVAAGVLVADAAVLWWPLPTAT